MLVLFKECCYVIWSVSKAHLRLHRWHTPFSRTPVCLKSSKSLLGSSWHISVLWKVATGTFPVSVILKYLSSLRHNRPFPYIETLFLLQTLRSQPSPCCWCAPRRLVPDHSTDPWLSADTQRACDRKWHRWDVSYRYYGEGRDGHFRWNAWWDHLMCRKWKIR